MILWLTVGDDQHCLQEEHMVRQQDGLRDEGVTSCYMWGPKHARSPHHSWKSHFSLRGPLWRSGIFWGKYPTYWVYTILHAEALSNPISRYCAVWIGVSWLLCAEFWLLYVTSGKSSTVWTVTVREDPKYWVYFWLHSPNNKSLLANMINSPPLNCQSLGLVIHQMWKKTKLCPWGSIYRDRTHSALIQRNHLQNPLSPAPK